MSAFCFFHFSSRPTKRIFHFTPDKGLLDRFCLDFNLMAGRKEDTTNTVTSIMWGIFRIANRMRESHFSEMRSPRLVSPGMILHPANFLEHLDKSMNIKDPFYNTFRVPFDKVDPGIKDSLNTIKVNYEEKTSKNISQDSPKKGNHFYSHVK
jgi:hypothetical protein